MAELQPIWPRNIKIEVLGVTGDYGSGKTLFVATIDPANTLLFDFEKSAGSYESLGMKRIDVPNVLYEKYKAKDGKYTPRQAFEWWLGEIKKIEQGTYSVIAVDPISDIEDGLVDWVASRFKEFGFSTEQKFRDMGGVFWGRVKSEWKRVLLGDIATKCQTFAFTTHLRQVFKYGRPVEGKYESKGKNTLRETASLFLTLSRAPRKSGDQPTEAPWANVDKNRLSVIQVVGGETRIKGVTPPILPIATPQAIREYILNPPDMGNLKEEERVQEKQLSKEEELELQREIAEANREAAEAQERASQTQAKVQAARERALRAMRPTDNGNGSDHDDGGNGTPAVVKDDQGPPSEDQRAVNLISNAEKAGVLPRVLKGVWKTLNNRGVSVGGFTRESAPEYVRLLTDEEFNKFEEHLFKLVK